MNEKTQNSTDYKNKVCFAFAQKRRSFPQKQKTTPNKAKQTKAKKKNTLNYLSFLQINLNFFRQPLSHTKGKYQLGANQSNFGRQTFKESMKSFFFY
jgi:hypothetical protein